MSTRQRAELAITDETKKEGSTAMSVESSKEGFSWSEKTRALAAGLLVAGMMATSLVSAPPAHAATTFTVNDTRDSPDASTAGSTCDIDVFTVGDQCTLRAAIQQANATTGADTINFNIPGTGVQTIHVNSGSFGALPPITEQVSIDGYTQPGASPNTLAVGNNAALKIELDGTNVAGGNSGLEILTADSSVIKGLVINRFRGPGIAISGDSVANRIEGNFVGTDATGTLDRGNEADAVIIFLGPSENVVGGTTAAARNVLSGNGENGVFIANSNANRIQGNYVGTDKSGTKDLGNGFAGIFINNARDTRVGGTTAAARNVISGNDSAGLDIFGNSQGTMVLGNRIGTTASGTGPLANAGDGVLFNGASDSSVGDGTTGGSNTIAFNGGDGVGLIGGGSIGNAISRNSIFSNGGLGIDLGGGFEDAAGKTANDPGDIDSGPNDLQNTPVLTSAKTVSGKTTIKGKLNSHPEVGYVIQFFSNPSGTNEGKKFIGQKEVIPNTSGDATFTFSPASKVALGQNITATATIFRGNNTSEFSAPKKVASS